MATMEPIQLTEQAPSGPHEIEAPAPTAWPVVLAFGFTLLCAGLLTSASVSVLGAVLVVAGCAGWFREVFPREHEIVVPVIPEELRIVTDRPMVDRLPVAPDQVRAWLPLRTHPVSAGVKGGLAGGVAMAVLACAYGLLKTGSIWYPINLLAATFYSQWLELGSSNLNSFHAHSFLVALGLHALVSTAVGLLYGAMLPMFPRRPILLGGVIAPVLWSGLIHSLVEFLDPTLGERINWPWFVVSQVGFGIVAGIVVSTQQKVRTWQHLPFAIRAGFEAPGAMDETNGEDLRQ